MFGTLLPDEEGSRSTDTFLRIRFGLSLVADQNARSRVLVFLHQQGSIPVLTMTKVLSSSYAE